MATTPIYALPYPVPTDPADVPADMQELAERLEVVLPTIPAPEAWHLVGGTGEPAFTNGWQNSPGYQPAAFYKDKAGIVRLRGIIRSGTIAQAAFTLPAAYRTTAPELTIPAVSQSAYGQVNLPASGAVIPQVGNPANFSLDGVSFRAG